MPNIIHVNYSKSGGSGVVAHNLSIYQKKYLHYNTTLLTKINKNLYIEKNKDWITAFLSGIDNFVIKNRGAKTFFSLLRNRNQSFFSDKLENFNGIIHLHWINGILDYEMINKLSQSKRIFWTLHDMEFFTGGCHQANECHNFINQCKNCPIVKKNFKKLVHINYQNKIINKNWSNIQFIVPSQNMKRKLISSNILNSDNILCIPNPVHEDFFNFNFDKAKIRAQYGVPPNALVVGFISGRINDPQKNFQNLISICSEVQKHINREIILITVGNVNKTNFKEYNFKTMHLGAISEKKRLVEFYSILDIHVSLSDSESFGLNVAEATAVGVPSIVLGTSASAELIKDFHTGFVCENLNHVKKIFYDFEKNSLKINKNNLRNYANLNWHPRQIMKIYESVYKF